MKSVVVVLLASVAAVSAHLCMLSPPQRGSLMGINTPGAKDCMLTTKPCGGRKTVNSMTLKAGQNFTVTFQKNLDHWVKATPGYFSVMWGKEIMPQLKQLVKIPDMGEPSLTLYSVNVTIPMDPLNMNYIIQTQYVTMNSKAPAVFYQCGDVMLTRM